MKLRQTSRKDIRKFGITLGIILAVIGTIQLLKGNTRIYPWLYAGSGLAFILGFFVPAVFKPIHFAFTKITRIIGSLITGLILTTVFYLILTPIGLIARLFGKDFLDVNWNKKSGTYWVPKEPLAGGVKKYEKQF